MNANDEEEAVEHPMQLDELPPAEMADRKDIDDKLRADFDQFCEENKAYLNKLQADYNKIKANNNKIEDNFDQLSEETAELREENSLLREENGKLHEKNEKLKTIVKHSLDYGAL